MAAAILVADMLRGFLGPESITDFIASKAPVEIVAVGSYISDAKPIGFTAALHEVEGGSRWPR